MRPCKIDQPVHAQHIGARLVQERGAQVVERVTADRLQGLHNEFRLAVDLDASQVLEARVYWFGDSNICVSALRVEPIG